MVRAASTHGDRPGRHRFLRGGHEPRQPTATTTSTATPIPTVTPLPTVTDRPTVTPTATSTRVPSATPTQRRVFGPIYLPVVLSEQCEVRKTYADVALVLDVSTTMRRATGSGELKYDTVSTAAMAFVALLPLAADDRGDHDQVAVVGFNDTAWIQQGLTSGRDAVESGLRALGDRMAEGTRLDLAIAVGADALGGPERIAANRAVLVLLTDGLPNRVPLGPLGTQEETVLAEAQDVKGRGILLYTIGVGRADGELVERINPELLRAVASAPGMYYETPDPLDLQQIYERIAESVTCPPDALWGRR